jgi:ATP synthase F1 gamma subunit
VAEKQIVEEIKSLENIQGLVQTYEEIAASRMQKVKNSVLSNREFLDVLGEIFAQVKFSYEREIAALKDKAEKEKSLSIIARNGKTVSVLLSANTGLYGDIIRNTFEKFLGGIRDKETDIVIVGRIGKGTFESALPDLATKDYKYFELSDSTSAPEDFREIISYIVEYEKVVVYHGRFESILSQVPVEDVLTGEYVMEEQVAVEGQAYIFEPSLPAIVSFFESEILASIFEQSLHESSLSKFASRMINLDRAVVNIDESLVKTNFRWQRARHQNMNKKQLGMLASMSLWG